METTEERAERHQGKAEEIAYELGTLLMSMSPNREAMKEAADKGDVGPEMEGLMMEAFNRGEGSPLFRRLVKVWKEMELALLVTCLVLCVAVPSVVFAVDLSLEELTANGANSWTSTSSYGAEKVQADAYLQERLDLNQYQAERSAEIQAPVTYGEPSYQNPVHNFTAYGPNGTALKCTQTSRTVDCF
ncbi:MAG: hypothetical protein LZF60_140039 [Nitrospira sp.]|nr:MAG: hypothetical protein LZF60_140039 [Nitrospira sp.]